MLITFINRDALNEGICTKLLHMVVAKIQIALKMISTKKEK